ncbi:MAG: hypothetical protein ACOZNI_26860 [Myxococcota bacterium]
MLTFLLIGCGGVGLDQYAVDALGPLVGTDPDGEVSFGDHVPDARSQATEVSVLSIGDEDAYVADVWVESNTDGVFFVPNDLPFPQMMEPGAEVPVTIRFAPTAVGTFHGVLVIEIGEEGTILERMLVGQGCRDTDDDGACDP